MISSILFPSDGSEFSLEAARYAAEIASKFDASVTVVHVIRHITEGIGVTVPIASPIPGQTGTSVSDGASSGG